MSKSTKTKKTSAKKPKDETTDLMVNQLPNEDFQALKIAVLERQNAQLGLQNLQQQLQTANTQLQDAQKKFETTVNTINTKYHLDPEKDRIDINTGAITRG